MYVPGLYTPLGYKMSPLVVLLTTNATIQHKPKRILVNDFIVLVFEKLKFRPTVGFLVFVGFTIN